MARRALEARRKREAEEDTANAKSAEQPENYVSQELARTRAQIAAAQDRLDKLVNGDPKDYKAVADALWRLREIERVLDCRPLPGSRRPGRERVTKESPSTAGPLD
jgi:hypothetical protein